VPALARYLRRRRHSPTSPGWSTSSRRPGTAGGARLQRGQLAGRLCGTRRRAVPRDVRYAGRFPTSATSARKKGRGKCWSLHYADRTGLDVLLLRIAVIFGPLYSNPGPTWPDGSPHLGGSAARLPDRIAGHWTLRAAARRAGPVLPYRDCAAAIRAVHTARAFAAAPRLTMSAPGPDGHPPRPLQRGGQGGAAAVLPTRCGRTSPPAPGQRQHGRTRLREEFGWEPGSPSTTRFRDYADWLADHDL